ncbi:MAG: hypothetical protein IJA97_04375, partial [Clostridia bacterium]|nr:hypothetical protein [Clostridia bacterium]
GTVENCYIDIAKENPTTRGPFAVIESNSSIKNCVINYPMAEDDYVFMNEAEKVSSQSLTAWGYGSLAQDVGGMTKTPTGYANIYVISKAPVSFSTGGATGLKDDTSASSAITYAENETKLLYPFKAFDEVHGDVEHTVQSTVGEHKEAYDKVQVTGKTRVVQSVQRYDSYEDFANSTYAGIELYNEHYNRDSRWVVTGNVPIWHSLIDEHTDKFYATVNNGTDLEIDCYETATFDVKLYGGSVEDLVLSTTSDLISIEDNVITALKVGEDASVTAKFKFGGKEYTRVYSVDVLVPFYFNDGTSDFDVSASVREGAELTLSVKIKGNNVENVTYATTATEFISLVDNKVTGVKLNKGNVVTASFTYEGTAYVLDIIIDVLDPIAEDAIVTINGVNLEDESFNVVIGENATIGIISGTSTVTSVSVVDAKGLFTTNNNVITAQLYGETTLQVSFTIGSKTHVKAVKATTERTTETITTAVDFDGYEGVILSSAIDNSGVVNAVVTYGEEDPFILNKENGGILADGKIRVKTAKLDAVAGFPYITKREFVESPVINVVLGTNKKIYTFTNVVFWTSIIEDATELKAALDMDYAVATHNHGFYKLANNIDATGMTFVYNKFTTAVANQNSNAGFMGLFDGCGYTISNYTVGQYGLFGAFLYNASSSAVGGPVIKDVAFTNVSATTGISNQGVYSLLGRYTPDHNYWPTCHLKVSNLYVSFKDDSHVNGLFGFNGYSHLNNIVIDTEGNTVAPGSVLAGDEYGAAVSGKAITFNHNQYTDGSALFQNTRFMNPERASTNYIDNVITLGATPVVYQWGYGTNYYNNWKYENNTWVKFNTGTLNPYLTIETYMGYAGNQEKGDIPVMTGMKDGFKAICGTNTDALKGYVCTTCGETFSLEAGECAKCSVALTEFANLWTTPWSFTWELTDIATWENLYENSVYKTGIYVFKGVSKYNTTNAMKSAYTADNTIFSSFTGEAGNNMWSVSADGVLSWKGTTAQA